MVRHYRVTAKLGEGGMGEVFLATDTQLDRLVAIKLLPAAIAADTARRQRFLAEARLASALTHPHVCTVHEVGETPDGRPYIVMEYLRGRTLAEVSRQQTLTGLRIASIAAQVADALDAAHELRMVHRDIKPSNISINERGQVKVLDFGLAKRVGESVPDSFDAHAETHVDTHSGQVVGTPGYMSPEQALGRPVDHRSDIFSLGVVIYELACGRRPFAGASLGDTLDRIVHHRPEPLTRIVPSTPAELERIVTKCLEKEPSRRYQHPRDLALDLDNLARQLETSGTPTPPFAPTPNQPTADVPPTPPPAPPPSAIRVSDIFISYAAADDKPLAADQAGWVSQFHRDLEVRVEQMFGEPATIWRHPDPASVRADDPRLVEALTQTKALVSVVSPPFARTPLCQREVECFVAAAEQSGTFQIEDRPRLLKVVKRPVEPGDWPAPTPSLLPALRGFEFFEQDPVSGRLLEYDRTLGPLAKQRYHERLYDLAQEVCHVLQGMRRTLKQPQPGVEPGARSGKTVFLAETTGELRQERDKLRRELTERGHRILPDSPLPLDLDALTRQLTEIVQAVDATVHLVGGRYGLVPEGAHASLPEIQLQIAQTRTRHIPLIVWTPEAIQPDDPRQATFIQRLRTDPELHARADVIQAGLNVLKDLVLRRIDPPPKTNPTPAAIVAGGPPRVYLVCDPADEESLAPLEDYLFDNGCEVSLPVFTGSSGDIAEAHRRNLQTCDAVLIYFGTPGSHWVEIKLLDLAQAPGYGRSRPFKAQAVVVPPSDDRRKNRFRTHLADVLRLDTLDDVAPLRSFLDKLHAPSTDAR